MIKDNLEHDMDAYLNIDFERVSTIMPRHLLVMWSATKSCVVKDGIVRPRGPSLFSLPQAYYYPDRCPKLPGTGAIARRRRSRRPKVCQPAWTAGV